MDPSLIQLRQALQAQYDALLAKRDTIPATDTNVDNAIRLELKEILHRIDLVENLKIIALTADQKAALGAVSEADQQLTQDLQNLTEAGNLIQSMSAYLGCVDKVIGLMKMTAFA